MLGVSRTGLDLFADSPALHLHSLDLDRRFAYFQEVAGVGRRDGDASSVHTNDPDINTIESFFHLSLKTGLSGVVISPQNPTFTYMFKTQMG
jgi:hypothetical protein